ncbi:MAG: hypothetical protein MMC33_010517 [Icmadophila ericetorum]|nr:hypothetical protein [Icmadophila ericetorum]
MGPSPATTAAFTDEKTHQERSCEESTYIHTAFAPSPPLIRLFKRPRTRSSSATVHWVKAEINKNTKPSHKKEKQKEWRKTVQKPRQAEAYKEIFDSNEDIDYRDRVLGEKYASQIKINQARINGLARQLRDQRRIDHDEYHAINHFFCSVSSRELQLYYMAWCGDDFDPTIEEFPTDMTENDLLSWLINRWPEVTGAAEAANRVEFARQRGANSVELESEMRIQGEGAGGAMGGEMHGGIDGIESSQNVSSGGGMGRNSR